MTRRTIPARTEVVCDRCGDVCSRVNHTKEGRVIMTYNPACHPLEFDLCDTCASTMYSVVTATINALKPLGGAKA